MRDDAPRALDEVIEFRRPEERHGSPSAGSPDSPVGSLVDLALRAPERCRCTHSCTRKRRNR
jgi:hypothetical protein